MNHNIEPTSSRLEKFFEPFAIKQEQENFRDIMQSIRDGIDFRGTNLWVLIFAILIASIGLNVNSSIFLIGAMLISPLMGPIIGIGIAIGVNDSALLRRSVRNFFFSIAVSLIASMAYFLVTPISDAHSELLARTSPNIYDVLIALFGGLAGVLAITSQKKGNVIPGAAIATSLIPPLCTAGYGIALGKSAFIFGALYLFFINAVFIALAAFLMSRILRFPYREFPDDHEKRRSRQVIILFVLLALIPSIYFGHDMVKQQNFTNAANRFIDHETQFPDNYLLRKNIDAKSGSIELIYGGKPITEEQINAVKNRLEIYGLDAAHLNIRQGFSSLLYETPNNEPQTNTHIIKIEELTAELARQEKALQSIETEKIHHTQDSQTLFAELEALSPEIVSLFWQSGELYSSGASEPLEMIFIDMDREIDSKQQSILTAWIKKRVQNDQVRVLFFLKNNTNPERESSESIIPEEETVDQETITPENNE